MRWRWWRAAPSGHRSWPDHGRDTTGRLLDGDQVRADGGYRWTDLLPGREALAEPTQHLPTVDAPLITPAQEWRSRGGQR